MVPSSTSGTAVSHSSARHFTDRDAHASGVSRSTSRQAVQVLPESASVEPVSVLRTVLGRQDGSTCMNETESTNENTTKKMTKTARLRRHCDAEFKKAAVEHCARHGGDLNRTAGELGVNYWTLRDWVEAALSGGK